MTELTGTPLIRARHWFMAATLWVVDGLVFGQAAFSLPFVMGCLVFCPLLALASGLLRNATGSVRWLLVGVPYAASLVLVLGTVWINNWVALGRSASVIAALDAFRVAHGAYPKQLSELSPEFLPQVPPARLSLASREFFYIPVEHSATLGWNAMPPFGRRTFDLQTRQWSTLD